MRVLDHQMIDYFFDYLNGIYNQPILKPIPEKVKDFFDSSIPEKGRAPE
ncbi:MAG: hypothetical protein PSV36_02485 [Algoriphagus sp.]|nr:hypothetical protein [Algoriphagus sp.]